MKNKPMQFTAEGAECLQCHEVVLEYPFGEGDQHRAMTQHKCRNERAQTQLMQVRDQIEDLLNENGMSLEAEWNGGNQTSLNLYHAATGEELTMGVSIP